MFRRTDPGVVAAFVIAGLVMSSPALFAQAPATLSIGASVATSCRISVDAAPGDSSPAVRVACGRSSLRTLRVTTSEDRGLDPVVTLAGSMLKAGGEVVFTVPVVLATVASRLPVVAPPPSDRGPVTITLDF